jgi:hypothetical protein
MPHVITHVIVRIAEKSATGRSSMRFCATLHRPLRRRTPAKGESQVTKTPAIAGSIDRSPCQIHLLFMLLFKPILDHRL